MGRGRRDGAEMKKLRDAAMLMFASDPVITTKAVGKALKVSQPTLIKWKKEEAAKGNVIGAVRTTKAVPAPAVAPVAEPAPAQ